VRGVRNAYENAVRKPEEKRLLGRPRHRWEDSLKKSGEHVEFKSGQVMH
jgi:hypothetical protein